MKINGESISFLFECFLVLCILNASNLSYNVIVFDS